MNVLFFVGSGVLLNSSKSKYKNLSLIYLKMSPWKFTFIKTSGMKPKCRIESLRVPSLLIWRYNFNEGRLVKKQKYRQKKGPTFDEHPSLTQKV